MRDFPAPFSFPWSLVFTAVLYSALNALCFEYTALLLHCCHTLPKPTNKHNLTRLATASATCLCILYQNFQCTEHNVPSQILHLTTLSRVMAFHCTQAWEQGNGTTVNRQAYPLSVSFPKTSLSMRVPMAAALVCTTPAQHSTTCRFHCVILLAVLDCTLQLGQGAIRGADVDHHLAKGLAALQMLHGIRHGGDAIEGPRVDDDLQLATRMQRH